MTPNISDEDSICEHYCDDYDIEILTGRMFYLELKCMALEEKIKVIEEKLTEETNKNTIDNSQKKDCSHKDLKDERHIKLGDSVRALNYPYFVGTVIKIGRVFVTISVPQTDKSVKKERRAKHNLQIVEK